MLGEPQDVEGECNARVFISDNYGDGSATIRCQLAPEHDGLHREQFQREGGTVTITWRADERVRCDHGCGQWDHAHRDEVPCPKYADDHEFSDCVHCHPDKPALTCSGCGKTHYYEAGHKRHCPKEPYTCVTCDESGEGPHDGPYGAPAALDVRLVEIQPHPDLTTTHPGWWRTKLAISYAGTSRTLWRWHKAPSEKTPTADDIIAWFWQTTFAELHGFNFDESMA